MAIIQQSLFSWQAVESSSEIVRFHLVLETINDERLMRVLEAERKGRRNDNPARAMWNSLIAMLVFRHPSIEALRAELMRNGELRQVCGFPLLERVVRVNGREKRRPLAPSKDAYHRFILTLMEHQDLLREIFDSLTRRVGELLPDFGRHLAFDGKAIVAAHKGDKEASIGVKKQSHPDGDATAEITSHWLGYKLHMLGDATYELAVAFDVTAAAEHESPRLTGLFEHVREHNATLLARAQTASGDRGYDDGADKAALYDEYGVKPLIPARDLKKGRFEPLEDQVHDTIYVSPTGQVCCNVQPFEADNERRFMQMQFMGYEEKRRTLKFRCPAAAFGAECANRAACACTGSAKYGAYGRVVRVKIDKDRRLFGPIYGHSYRFKDLYKMRTSVERLFSRLDHMYNFERHNTVGLARMKTRVTLALIAMQATAVGWIELGQKQRVRCLRPAA